MNSEFGWNRRWHWLYYLWTAPNTIIGLMLGVTCLMTGGKCRRVGLCLEFSGGSLARILPRMPTGSGAVAMTLGHVILGINEPVLAAVRRHEWVHVKQYERWGILFIPAYLFASVWQWIKRRDPYRDNPFEVEAFREEEQHLS